MLALDLVYGLPSWCEFLDSCFVGLVVVWVVWLGRFVWLVDLILLLVLVVIYYELLGGLVVGVLFSGVYVVGWCGAGLLWRFWFVFRFAC